MSELGLDGDLKNDDLLQAMRETPSAGRAPRRGPRVAWGDLETTAPPVSPPVLWGVVRLIEFLLIMIGGVVVYLSYVGFTVADPWLYAGATLCVSAAAIVAFQFVGLYEVTIARNFVGQVGRLAAAWGAVFATVLGILFFAKLGEEFSRAWMALWYVAGLLVLSAERAVLSALLRHWIHTGRLQRRAVIVGGGANAEQLIEALEGSAETDIRICGIFDDRSDDRSPLLVAGHRKLGTVDDLVTFARRTRVDLLIVSLPITAETRVLQMLKKLWVLPLDIRLSAHTNKLRFRPRSYSFIGDVPMLDVFDKPITDWDYVSKTLFDRAVGGLMLLASLPAMLLIAAAIKLDSRGPVLFRQRRFGFNNELIEVFKFRSMYAEQTDAHADKLVTRGDPRVTRVGRFLRKTSLDELPQLINVVFRGDLSLVGPRPHAVHAKAANQLYDEVVDGYFARHRVKPGITGWAQVNGWRGETDTSEKIQRRVEHDLEYIENWSVLFDLYILAVTPVALVRTEHAY